MLTSHHAARFAVALAASCAIATCVAGCNSKTQKQVYDEARPAADALRAKVVAAATLVDKKPPTPSTSTCKTTKKLTFDPKSDAHDTDYMMVEEAKRGGGKPDDKHQDESLSLIFPNSPLGVLLRVTSPNPTVAPYMLTGKASQDTIDLARRALNVKNVVLVRNRLGVFDYFLVDLATAAPSVVCTGTFTPTSDPALAGAHTQEYVTITKNRRTGKEVKRETSSVTTDPSRAALYDDAKAQFATHMQKELGLAGIE